MDNVDYLYVAFGDIFSEISQYFKVPIVTILNELNQFLHCLFVFSAGLKRKSWT